MTNAHIIADEIVFDYKEGDEVIAGGHRSKVFGTFNHFVSVRRISDNVSGILPVRHVRPISYRRPRECSSGHEIERLRSRLGFAVGDEVQISYCYYASAGVYAKKYKIKTFLEDNYVLLECLNDGTALREDIQYLTYIPDIKPNDPVWVPKLASLLLLTYVDEEDESGDYYCRVRDQEGNIYSVNRRAVFPAPQALIASASSASNDIPLIFVAGVCALFVLLYFLAGLR